MVKIVPQPYRVIGKIQHYKWGTRNENAYIPKLIGMKIETDIPYAEYWIGVHPKATSEIEIEEKNLSLQEVINSNSEEILGKRIFLKYGRTIPFLFKILSIGQALSIQAHPDKSLAEILHQRDPKNYPDSNHKPEIAIAIDNLRALVGIKDLSGLKKSLEENPEIKKLLNVKTINDLDVTNSPTNDIIRIIYSEIMNADQSKIEGCITGILNRLKNKENLSIGEGQFLVQHKIYGYDIGLISILLFNLIDLNMGEAIFTPAGIPHAYIQGNIIECMANSDNVVRAGLTQKYKDIKTLMQMLDIDSSKALVNKVRKNNSITYKTSAEEFEVSEILFENEITIENNNEFFFLAIIEGTLKIKYGSITADYRSGEFILIPAILTKLILYGENNPRIFKINVPQD